MQRLALSAACIGILLAASVAEAYRPEITGTVPRGLQRGTSATVILEGTRVKDARQLLLDRGGIDVKGIKAIDDRKVELQLEVPEATEPGLYPLRLVTETGLSNVIMFSVGAMPQVDEVEPNSEFGTPQSISSNVTIEGVVAREDEDYYAVTLKEGEPLTAELEGVRIKKGRSNPFFDPYIAILDSNRFELATSDDAPLLQQDCVCSIRAPEDGTYLIVVRDSSFGGNNDRYRLHVGNYPRPIAVVPAGGPPGEIVDMTFTDLHGDAWIEKVQLPSEVSDAYPLVVSGEGGVSPSPNFIRIQPMPNVIEQEPNNSFKESTGGPLPAAFCGVLGQADDVDYFSFDAKKGQTAQIRVFGRSVLRSAIDSVINVYNEKGGRVGGNDDSGGPDSLLQYKIPADGKYHVAINDHLRGGGPGYAYRIEVQLAEPQLTLSLPDRRRYEATQIDVPQGNRAAVMINASRQGFGGAIDIEALNLPEGVTVTPLQMPANQTTVPLLLTAAADAKLDGRLVQLVGKVVDNPNVASRFTQRHQLLIGRNNSVVYDYNADNGAVSVINKLPCTLEVVQPQVPVVRNGSANLVVKVNREEGFDSEISVRMLYNPPGIGSSGSIKIAKGATEANIPITANGSAAIGKWPVIVYGYVSGNEIATEPVMLEIADKIFNFGFPNTSSELGGEASVLVDVEVTREFEGKCEVELVGIPAGVVCEKPKMEVTSDTEQIVFPVKIDAKARVGQHKTLVARATITSDKGVILQTQGTGTLQIDKPIPAAVAKPARKKETSTPAAKAAPAPVAKKPLSRLEQLRQMREQARQRGE